MLDEIKGRALTAANDLLRFTRRIFAFGVRRRFLLSNPAADLSPRLDAGGTERPRSRALSSDELAQLFDQIRETPSFGEDNFLAIDSILPWCRKSSIGSSACGCWQPAANTSSRSAAGTLASECRTSASTHSTSPCNA